MKYHQKNILSALFFLGLCILIFALSQKFYKRFDLTSDNRYTLSTISKEVIDNIKNPVRINILFDQDIPIEYKKLQIEVLQILEEYKNRNSYISFEFINPLKENKHTEQTLKQLTLQGIYPLQVNSQKQGKSLQEYFFPWAMVSSGDKTIVASLLKNKLGIHQQELIKQSVQYLEYTLTDALYKLQLKNRKKIAILKSNGTLSDIHMADFIEQEKSYYNIAPFSLDASVANPMDLLKQLNEFQLLIIAKPTVAFTDIQKQIIDQFILQGGNVLWLIDVVSVSLEQMMENQGKTLAMPLDLNLGDLFFKYGIRINYDLIKDPYFTQIVVAQGQGNQTQYQPIPWAYHPMIISKANHLINSNLGALRLQFTNSIDTLSNHIKKYILLKASHLATKEGVPQEISLKNALNFTEKTNASDLTLGVLLEGEFSSVYENRIKPEPQINHKNKGVFSKMIVISDGDIIKNDITQGQPLELGYDKWTNNFYDNKYFLQNCIDYLLNQTQLLTLRNKKIHLPSIDKEKLNDFTPFKVFSLCITIIWIAFLQLSYYWVYLSVFKKK